MASNSFAEGNFTRNALPELVVTTQIGGKKMNSEVQNNENKEKGDGKKKLLVGIVIAVIAVLLFSVVAMASLLIKNNKAGEKAEEPKEQRAVVTAENVEEVLQDLQQEVADVGAVPQSYIVTQNGEWIFPDGKSPSTNALVENDALNETAVYFDVKVNDTEEIIYSSPILELGAQLSGFSLDKALDAGTYACTVVYHLVDEDQNELTTVNVGTSVIVEN